MNPHQVILSGICIFVLAFCPYIIENSYASPEPTKTEKIEPPSWLLGSWGNLYESDANKIVYFIFQKNDIEYKLGAGKDSHFKNWKVKYKDHKIVQTYDDNTYKIGFIKDNSQIFYEFKIQKADSTHPESMTYAIIEDNLYLVSHSAAARTLLLRM